MRVLVEHDRRRPPAEVELLEDLVVGALGVHVEQVDAVEAAARQELVEADALDLVRDQVGTDALSELANAVHYG
jgi:hypothetical protein